MSQQIQEQLSALMDGELQRDETMFLLRRVESDVSLLARWSGYHVARQALRRQEILPIRADFAASIMAAIEVEAVPAALGRSRTATLLRWGSGGAIAASVAVAALIATGPGGGGPASTAQPGSMVSTQAPATPATPPPSLPAEFRAPLLSPALDAQTASAGGFSSGAAAPIDPRLQSYLIRHYDAAGSTGQAGMVPYVLLIVPGQTQQQISTRETTPAEVVERQQRR